MDLDLNLLSRVNPRAESITLWDNTGVGSAFAFGWQNSAGTQNVVNPKKSDVASINIRIVWNNGLDQTYNLTAPERAMYLDPTQGFTLTVGNFLSGATQFPDGIVFIYVTIGGAGISGLPAIPWTQDMTMPEVFLTTLQNQVRNWVIGLPIEVKNLDQIFDPAFANLLLDTIYYDVQFYQIDKAQKVFDHLYKLVNSGKKLSDFVATQNL